MDLPEKQQNIIESGSKNTQQKLTGESLLGETAGDPSGVPGRAECPQGKTAKSKNKYQQECYLYQTKGLRRASSLAWEQKVSLWMNCPWLNF